MKTVKFCFRIFLAMVFLNILHAEENISAEQIMDKSYKATKVAGYESISTLVIADNRGRERIRKIAAVSKLYDSGETEKRLIRFLSPADVKGTGLLTFDYERKDDDIWLFLPALRKTRRIISSEKSKSFMGSEFSYADMTPPNLEDFQYKSLGEEDIDGMSCWKIEMNPVNEDIADENGFSKKIAYVAQKDYVIRKAIYFDLDGELHKELSVLEVKELDLANHKFKPIHMVMENKQNERKSSFKIEQIQFKPEVKDEYFTTRYLERM